jgi:hypothetical protein
VLHGTPPRLVVLPHHQGRVPVDRTGPVDFVRAALGILGAVSILVGFVRWNDQREGELEPYEAEKHYGESIIDARTSVDPMVGMRPVNSEPKPR